MLRYFEDEPSNPITAWQEAVQEFLRLHLTYDSDRLPSIAALALIMSQVRGEDKYLAGLWRSSLLYDLQWYALGEGSRSNINTPTWSWASVIGGIGFYRRWLAPYVLPSVTLLEVLYVPDGPVHIGKSSQARIAVEGCVSEVTRRYHFGGSKLDCYTLEDPNDVLGSHDIGIQSWADFDPDTDQCTQGPDERLIALFLTKRINFLCGYSGLVLRKLDNTVYERVGWLEIDRPGRKFHADPGPEYWEPLDKFMAALSVQAVTIV
jgi:hypothetical protein